MKIILKIQLVIISAGLILFCSCNKNLDRHTNVTPVNWLSGQEFIFHDLTWRIANEIGSDEIFVMTDNRPDLFFSNAAKQVFLQLDSSNAWIPIPEESITVTPPPSSFTYAISYYNSTAFLAVGQNPPLNYHLIGRTASIRVKYL